MANLIVRPGWHIPERLVTPEEFFLNRRGFLTQMGRAGAGALAVGMAGCSRHREADATPLPAGFPAARNPGFNPGWRLTNERVAARYNNFFEFSPNKGDVRAQAAKFETAPWPVQISGLVEKPLALDAAELAGLFPLEERVYRFRCVEAWAMVVPWTGFPLSKLIEQVAPLGGAKFVRFESFHRPEQTPHTARMPERPWPYREGLRIEEAMHPLTFLAAGIYGHPLPKQHGAPLRLVVPWKYGFKSIKSIAKIEFVAEQPGTFWETILPGEYPFEANVNPKAAHPRWSQVTEQMIDTGDRVRTRPFNGYGDPVAKLYEKS